MDEVARAELQAGDDPAASAADLLLQRTALCDTAVRNYLAASP